MAKRRYRSVEIKKIRASQLAETIEGDRIVVAVDIAKVEQYASVMDSQQRVHAIVRWKHPQQSRSGIKFVKELGAGGRQVEVAMEPSGVYGDALRWALHQASVPVFRVNPKRSHDAA